MKRLLFIGSLLAFTMSTSPGCNHNGETTVNEVTDADVQQELNREQAMQDLGKSGGYGN